MLTTGPWLRSDNKQHEIFLIKNVCLEPGGGPGHRADGRHHPRHPRQHLPRPQRPEQVLGLRGVEL